MTATATPGAKIPVPAEALEELLEDWYWGMRSGEYESVDDCDEIERRIAKAWRRRRRALGLPEKPEPYSESEGEGR